MEHSVVAFPDFSVTGLGLDCPGFDASGIGELWTRFNARAGELPHGRVWGVGLPRENGFYYVAGHETAAGAPVPEGMETAPIPGARYFCVDFHDHPAQMGPTYSRMFSELIPAAGLRHAPGPVCLKLYGPDWHDEAAGKFRLKLYVQLAD
jgi:predicted transcriptional regulator YdeE